MARELSLADALLATHDSCPTCDILGQSPASLMQRLELAQARLAQARLQGHSAGLRNTPEHVHDGCQAHKDICPWSVVRFPTGFQQVCCPHEPRLPLVLERLDSSQSAVHLLDPTSSIDLSMRKGQVPTK